SEMLSWFGAAYEMNISVENRLSPTRHLSVSPGRRCSSATLHHAFVIPCDAVTSVSASPVVFTFVPVTEFRSRKEADAGSPLPRSRERSRRRTCRSPAPPEGGAASVRSTALPVPSPSSVLLQPWPALAPPERRESRDECAMLGQRTSSVPCTHGRGAAVGRLGSAPPLLSG